MVDSDTRFHLEEPWQPETDQERLTDEQWRRQLGFGLSELDLSRQEVDLMANPFRSPKEGLVFVTFLQQGLIHTRNREEEPLSLEEVQHLTPLEKAKIMVTRLNGKEGLSRYLKSHIEVCRAFRHLMDQMMDEDPEFRSTLGLDTQGPKTYSE